MALVKEVKVGDRKIKFEFNKFAKQANGSVMVTSGGTQVLVTACAATSSKPGQDFFPLGVDYSEKLYAAGRVPGGYRKREGRPADHETLTARVIDRPLRPCFPEGFLHETVISCTVVSYELGYSPAQLALMGASAALMVSDIPFEGPVCGLNIGMDNEGNFVVDPSEDQMTDLDLTIAAKPGAVLMVEAGANFLSEEKMLEAIAHAQELMKPVFEMQLQLREEIGKEKMSFETNPVDEAVMARVKDIATPKITNAFAVKDKIERYKALDVAKTEIIDEVITDSDDADEITPKIKQCIDELKYTIMRGQILHDKTRIDGRSTTEIRPIACEVDTLLRAHGSSLFTRGETQALASVTLGAPADRLRYETLYNRDAEDFFMLHYNFPPYCVGEARMPRSTSRREIGHGTLAKKALERVIPSQEDFGYTVRVVSEVLESNGSSSMATVCSGTMALLNAGVPIKEPIAGIAMGLVKKDETYTILSDILGDEDHLGDMDFKVCGGKDGITALQMDIKIGGLSNQILEEALAQAKDGRLHILGKMSEAISEVNEVSELAPQIFKLVINKDKVRDLIGPGGKNVKKIIADTGCSLDIDDSGVVSITAPDTVSAEAAKSMVRTLTTDPEVGAIYLGRVTKVVDFGCFVEITPGTEGLVHISQLEEGRVEKVTDIVNENDEIMVKLIDIDRQGRLKLSRKDAIGQKPTEFK